MSVHDFFFLSREKLSSMLEEDNCRVELKEKLSWEKVSTTDDTRKIARMAGTNILHTDVREFMRSFIIGVYFFLCSIVKSVFVCQDNLVTLLEGGIRRVILYVNKK